MTLFLAFALSLLFSFSLAPLVINGTSKYKVGQPILKYVEQHKQKQGTPTMGGIIFVLSIFFITFCLAGNGFTLGKIAALITLSYAVLGFLDDLIKIKSCNNEGLKPYQKLIGQVGIAVIASLYASKSDFIGTSIMLPFSERQMDLGYLYVPIITLFFVAVTNSFNLTDGLDGLLSSVSVFYFFTYAVILVLLIISSKNSGQTLAVSSYRTVLVFVATIVGGLLCFLCYNGFPAKIFMGDTGSLALGGAAATVAVFSKNIFAVLFVGITAVISCITVIIQVIYFKMSKGKRIFLMAPYHHHLEKKGIKESKIVTLYSVITIIGGIVAILSLYVAIYGFMW